MRGEPGQDTRPHTRLPSNFLGMDAWMTSQLKVALSRKLRGLSMCLAYICDKICMGVSTTRHGQASGRLVQELSVRTVCTSIGVLLPRVCTNVFIKDILPIKSRWFSLHFLRSDSLAVLMLIALLLLMLIFMPVST